MGLEAQEYTIYTADGYPIDESTINNYPALVIVSNSDTGEYGITELTE